MYRILNENSSFRELDIPLQPACRKELEKSIRKCPPIDPFPIWQDWILIGHEKYEMCIKFHRIYFCREMHFNRKYEAVAWICREQLKRVDLCHAAKAWMISRLYETLKDAETRKYAEEQFQYKLLSPSFRSEDYTNQPIESTQVMKQIAQEYGYFWRTIQQYVRFGRELDQLDEWFPGTRRRVLMGEVAVIIKHFHLLMQMPQEELRKMVDNPACKLLKPHPELLDETRQIKKPRRKVNFHIETAIKNMPAYDPDAELNGLSFTIGAWVKAMNRTREKSDFSHATLNGKERLRSTLAALNQEISCLERMLEAQEND